MELAAGLFRRRKPYITAEPSCTNFAVVAAALVRCLFSVDSLGVSKMDNKMELFHEMMFLFIVLHISSSSFFLS